MSRGRILIVEDEAIVALDIEERLISMGYELAGHVSSGEEAMELAQASKPDLVLMDIRLHGEMDGIDAAGDIHRRYHLPVIFLTAYSEEATLDRAKLAEPYGYILKPFDDRELKSAIEIALYKHASENEIRRMNRLYDVLSQVNQLIVRTSSREDLLDSVCRLIVERGAADLAWIGWLESGTSRIQPVAIFGGPVEFVEQSVFYTDSRLGEVGNPGQAIRTGKPFVCARCNSETCQYPVALPPAEFGCQSCASFPLGFEGQVCGVLSLCVSEPDYFREREIDLLTEVALDISFALDKIKGDDDRKQAEAALIESEERYRALIETAAEAIVVAQDGMLMYVNRAAEVVSGYSHEDLISRPFIEFLVHPGDRERLAANYERGVSGEPRTHEEDYRIIKSDGTVSWIRITTATMLWNGRPATLNMCTDITRQIRQEREIKLLNRLYAVLSHVNQAVVRAKDIQRFLDKACRIVVEDGDFILAWIGRVDLVSGKIEPAAVWASASEHVTAFSAHTDDDWSDQDPVRVCIREQRTVVFNEFLEDGHDRPWLTDNGRLDMGSTASFPIRLSKKIWGVLTIHAGEAGLFGEKDVALLEEVAGDIGFALANLEKERLRRQTEEEKEHLETRLAQAQKMESVGRLAGGVAHDFNNALSVIIGYAEMALTGLDKDHPLYRHLKEIQNAGHHSAALTRQLLAFARKQTVHPRLLDLNTAITGSIKMLQRLIGENIALEWRPGANLRQVKMDPSQIDQILANMAVNARDAIAGVGRVSIQTSNVTLDEAFCVQHVGCDPGQYVMLSIVDNGVGMTSDVLEKIFEPFFTTKEMGKGTGLGLATVFGIIKQNNGYIEVDSTPGEGTVFNIYLPSCDGETEQPQLQTKAKRLRGGNETILLVDDARQILDIGKMMLERLGYTVFAAPMPSQAIEVARQYSGPIHLLITDVIMPEMNGRDLTERLHEIHPEMRCLYMSGYTADVIAHQGVLDEGLHFIQKPYKPEELAELIREVLDQAGSGNGGGDSPAPAAP